MSWAWWTQSLGTVPGHKAWGCVGAGAGAGTEADGQWGEPIWGGIPQPPNNVPDPLLHTQAVTGASAQAGMCFLWILLPQGATLCHPRWAQHTQNKPHLT